MKHLIYRFPLLKHALSPILATRRYFLGKYVLRSQVEQASASLFHESVLLSVVEFEGTFRIDPKSHIFRRLVLHGHYEPILAELCKALIDANRDVIDVGANIGFFTVLSAKHTQGKVYSVEPTDNAFALLQENIDYNSVGGNVFVFNGAIADKEGDLTIEFISGMEEYSSICGISHPSAAGEKIVNKIVPCTTLEKLVVREDINPGFIKMDVEGAEARILSAAWSVFEKYRPTLISEFSPRLLERGGTDPQVIIRTLKKLGYRLIDPIMPKLALGKREYGDLLAVPEEKYSTPELMETVCEAHAKAAHHHIKKK